MKPGEVLAGRYELRNSLSRGRGELFLAHDRLMDRPVAARVFDTAQASSVDLQRYASLLVAAASVTHPAVVVPRIQVAPAESPPFVVGEVLRGEDLASFNARTKPVPWPRALAIAHACAEGLAALSAATGVAHRALRPGNVWVAEDGQAQLLDFGIAELGASVALPRPDGSFAEYRAPEQLQGAPGDARSDVYSLGVLLFEMMTGVHPFHGPSAAAVTIKALMQPAPSPSQFAPQIPPPLAALISRALARRPKERFADASILATELAVLLPTADPGAEPGQAARPTVTVVPKDLPGLSSAMRPEPRHEREDVFPMPTRTIRAAGQGRVDPSAPDARLALPPIDRSAPASGRSSGPMRGPLLRGRDARPAESDSTLILPENANNGSGAAEDHTEILPGRESKRPAGDGEHTLTLTRGESRESRIELATEVLPAISPRPDALAADKRPAKSQAAPLSAKTPVAGSAIVSEPRPGDLATFEYTVADEDEERTIISPRRSTHEDERTFVFPAGARFSSPVLKQTASREVHAAAGPDINPGSPPSTLNRDPSYRTQAAPRADDSQSAPLSTSAQMPTDDITIVSFQQPSMPPRRASEPAASVPVPSTATVARPAEPGVRTNKFAWFNLICAAVLVLLLVALWAL